MKKTNNERTLYFTEQITKAMGGIFDYPSTIFEAPMGYGKTTAVREYIRNSNAKFIWQRVYDNSKTSFWSGFCNMFENIDMHNSHKLIQLGFPNDSVSLQKALNIIENIVLQERTVMVIDDYHLINKDEVNSLIEFLIVNEIDNLHIVLITRFIELPNMDELLLKGYLYHITKDSFEINSKEIIKYYKLCGITINANEADKLYFTTEGWISALYLMMLNYKEYGSFMTNINIYKLVENAIFKQYSEDIKEFLLNMCIFNKFTKEQAVYIWGDVNAEMLLESIISKNAFVNYDETTKIYQIHNILLNYLQEILDNKDDSYKKYLYERAGEWYSSSNEYLVAMNYFYLAGDFEKLIQIFKQDRGKSIGTEQKDICIRYFEECPEEIKQKHLIAMITYALCLMTFNEMELFEKVCNELEVRIESSSFDSETKSKLRGEYELLLSFNSYNDIMKMSEFHRKACKLLKEPTSFLDTKDSWTFGSPSVLYMFHRKTGDLEKEVLDIKEAMPYYYKLTEGHGMGAEYVMEAEWYFNQGDFENAEIIVHKALYLSNSHGQHQITVCAMFLQVRLAIIKGDYQYVIYLLKKMQEEPENSEVYAMLHTIDLCRGFVYGGLKQNDKVPLWIDEGEFNSSRLLFPAMSYFNIVYGRVLLIKGEYLKLLGISEHFTSIASIFPNLLTNIYTTIYNAAANERIYRRTEALECLRQALDMAVEDKLYMPFVENCDFLSSLFEELYGQGIHKVAILRILELYRPYQKSISHIIDKYFKGSKPKLTERELDIVKLVTEGLSNKTIAERLFVSQNTVKTHLKSIFEKLGVNSRTLLKQYNDKNNIVNL